MFNPAYRIVTPRLVIRCYNPTDAVQLALAVTASLDHLLPWMPWAAAEPEPLSVKVDRLRHMRSNFDLNIDYVYGIFNLEETCLVGGTGLHPRVGSNALEIGYWIHKDFINRGYATETSAALTRVAFEINKVQRVEIHHAVENVRSASVPRKLGYAYEATLRERSFAHGISADQKVWSLTAAEYPRTPSAQQALTAFDAAGRKLL